MAMLLANATLGGVAPAKDLPATGAKPVLEDRYPQRRSEFPGGVTGLADLTYSTVIGFRPLTLDLYLPPKAKQTNAGAPAIVFVHGGGWVGGHTRHSGAFENWPGVLASLAAKGYVVASVSYRLSGEAPSPAAEQDIKSAVRWLRGNAAGYGIDKQHIGIWGGSAGGQLAALAGTSCGVAALDPPATTPATMPATTPAANGPVESDCVQAVVTWYGVFNFEPLAKNANVPPPVARYLGCTAAGCTDDKIALASAIRYVDRSDPPFLLIHGSVDKTVAPGQSQEFYAALQSQGVKSELLILPDVGHSFVGATAESTRSASLQALQKTFDFFAATLGKASQ
jgi:acetyl esterase/lipase